MFCLVTCNVISQCFFINSCYIRNIIYSDGISPPNLPSIVLLHVPQYRGPSFLTEPNIVPICPIKRQWVSSKANCHRVMIPLTPAYAISIHKSQGMSLDKVMINLGPREFASGLSYTAISRCKNMCYVLTRSADTALFFL